MPCIAINNSYTIAPFADILYFADFNWWEWHARELAFAAWPYQKVTIDGFGMRVPDARVHMLRNYGVEKLADRPDGIHSGLNGGYQAVNIAYLAGAACIALIGYDMRFNGAQTHFHKGHPHKTPEGNYVNYARRFHSMLPQLKVHNVEVINCTGPHSALNAFPRDDLERVLSRSRSAVV